jgi:hypothetical protein
MSKHVLDREHRHEGVRAARYAEVERKNGAEGTHPSSRLLHQRPQSRTEGKRASEIYRAGRGAE